MEDEPLISFAVRLHNCEPFVRSALRGAFSQSYAPLEIVIGDDCSSDRSFEIARDAVGDYRGPHQVTLFRTERNLGCGGMLQEVFRRAKGEIVVIADGDDVSHPERVQATFDAFSGQEDPPVCVVCRGRWVDFEGRPVPETTLAHEPALLSVTSFAGGEGLMGGLAGLHRQVFEAGRPLDGLRQQEDRVLGFRALCIGRIDEIPRVLVDRRVHLHNYSGPAARLSDGKTNRQWLLRNLEEQMAADSLMIRDGALLCARGYLTREAFEQTAALLRARLRRLRLSRALWRRGWVRRVRLCARLLRQGMTLRGQARLLLQLFTPSLAVMLLRRNPAYRVAVRQRTAAPAARPRP